MKNPRDDNWDYRCKQTWQRYGMPLMLGLIATIAVLGLWQQFRVQEQQHVAQLVRHEADAIEMELNRELANRLLTLQHMAVRWRVSGGTSRPLWEADAATLVEHEQGYQAIEWVDPTFHVRWVVPQEGNEAAYNLDLSQESRRLTTLRLARDLHQTIVTRSISLVQGGKGFLACVPLFVDAAATPGTERFDGFILGVFRFDTLFAGILKASPQYGIQIYDGTQLIYSQGQVTPSPLAATVVVQGYNADWQVQVLPTAALISEGRSLLPCVVLWGGVTGAWVLAFLVYLGQRATYHAQRARQINQQLHGEIDERKASEAALRQSESTLRSFFNSEAMLMGIVELQGEDIFHLSDNQTTATFFGTTPEAMRNRFASEMGVSPAYLNLWIQAYRRAEQTQAPVRFDYLHETATEQRWLSATVCRIADSSNQHPRFSYVVEDITERKQVEHDRREMLKVMEHALSGISKLDAQGRYRFVNQAYADITGYTLDAMLGMNWQQTVHPQDLEPMQWAYQQMIHDGKVEVEAQGIRPDGSSFHKQLVLIAAYDDQHHFVGHYCFMKDISERVRLETERKQVEAALHRSEATQQAIIQAIPDLLIRMKSDGQYVEFISNSQFNLVNPELHRQGTRVQDVLPSHLAQRRLHYSQQALESGTLQVYDQEIVIQGKQCYEEVRILPLPHQEVLVMVRDITDRKQVEADLRHQKEMFQAIVDHIPVMIVLLKEQDQVELVNPELERRLGWSLQEWKQRNILVDCYPDSTYRQAVLNHISAATGEWKDWTTLNAAGQILATSWANVRLSNGWLLGIGQDISDRKQKEESLRQAMQAAEAANLAKSTFLANMSHELRTPLNVILGFAQVMAHDPALTLSQRDDLQTIRRSGGYLLSLINDVLDLSKIEAGHCSLEESGFDLISLLHTLRTMMTERANARHLQLIFDIAPDVPQFVTADEQKLRQVLLNLLSNAIKFTQQGYITLHASVSLPRLHLPILPSSLPSITLQFDIIDTGVGIALDDQGAIFDAFVQADAGKTSTSGTGLGLAISRKLLDLMGGDIRVQSIPQQGSTFTVTLPVRLASGAQLQPDHRDRPIIGIAAGGANHRILVVDDQQDNRSLLMRLLTQLGLEVRGAADGLEAIHIWQDWQPDLTWMDIRMPGLDGYETTKRIRAMEQNRASVIIALTAQASQSDRALALAAGCNDYVSKPFREETLFLKLKEYLNLEYIYADEHPPLQPYLLSSPQDSERALQNIDPALLSSLPRKWVESLEAATVRGDDRAIAALICQLSSPYAPLRAALTEWVENFQFEQILKLIQRQSSGLNHTPHG